MSRAGAHSARVPWRHRAAAALVGALEALARALPLTALEAVADAVGWLAWALSPKLRSIGHANLERVFPEYDPRARRRVLLGCARSLGRSGAEALSVAYGRRSVGELVDVPPEAREALSESAHGVVLATLHLGNWELLGATLSSLGLEVVAVVRRPRNAAVAARITDLRARLGVTELPRGPYVALHALRALRRGALVGLLCDQASDQANVLAPFLGHLALTPAGAATLARRTGAVLVVAWLRRGDDGRHTLRCVRVAPGGDDQATMEAVNGVLSGAITEWPEGWVWFHDRWRTREGPATNREGSEASGVDPRKTEGG